MRFGVSRVVRGLVPAWFLAFLVVASPGCARFQPTLPEETADGLARVYGTQLAAAYVRPGTRFDGYRAIRVMPVAVAFDPDWDREHRIHVSASERERIREQVSRRMTAELREAIAARGRFAIAEESRPDVLVLRAELRDLELSAVDDSHRSGRVDVYALHTSRATLHAELQDAETRALLVRVIDREHGRQRLPPLLWRSSTLESYAELERAMRTWSRQLLDVLGEAEAGAPRA